MSSYQFKKYRNAKIKPNGLKPIGEKYRNKSTGDPNTRNIMHSL